MISEWVGPRCSRPSISRSTSDITEAMNSKGMFTFTPRSLDVALPDKYPRARCPTAYMSCPSYFCVFGYICEVMGLSVSLAL